MSIIQLIDQSIKSHVISRILIFLEHGLPIHFIYYECQGWSISLSRKTIKSCVLFFDHQLNSVVYILKLSARKIAMISKSSHNFEKWNCSVNSTTAFFIYFVLSHYIFGKFSEMFSFSVQWLHIITKQYIKVSHASQKRRNKLSKFPAGEHVIFDSWKKPKQ